METLTRRTAALPQDRARAHEAAAALPWYCWAVALGATSIVVGVIWDISWHRTIGRDTFWTPAHMAIYLGGLVPGLACGWLVLSSTFGRSERPAAVPGVRFWGFTGPLGAWVVVWGALAMLTSAPFDDWWHNAYGLDVEIISPPHMVLASGMIAVILGAFLLLAVLQNRATAAGEAPALPAGERPAALLFLWVGAVLLGILQTLAMEYSSPQEQHSPFYYQLGAAFYPVALVAVARASRLRWAATLTAAASFLLVQGMNWILPLFEATPLLAPIYNPVDHMVPSFFAQLLFVPAVAVDLAMRLAGPKGDADRQGDAEAEATSRRGLGRESLAAGLAGAGFLAVTLAVQYPFSSFLLSPAARNGFFQGDRWFAYYARVSERYFEFWGPPLTAGAIAVALGLAIASALVGLGWGRWLARVKR